MFVGSSKHLKFCSLVTDSIPKKSGLFHLQLIILHASGQSLLALKKFVPNLISETSCIALLDSEGTCAVRLSSKCFMDLDLALL